MVEVRHHVPHPHPLLSDQILHWYFYVVELDERRPRAQIPADLQPPHRHARVALQRDLQHAQAARAGSSGPHGHRGVVAPDAVRDPLLGAVDDVEFPIGRLGGGRADVCDVGPGAGLGDRDAGPLATCEEVGEEARLQVGGAEFDDRRHAEGHADGDARAGARDAGAVDLVDVDGRVDVVPFGDGDVEDVRDADVGEGVDRQWRGEVRDQHVVRGEGVEEGGRGFAGFFPFRRPGQEVLFHPGAAGFLESVVRWLVLGRGEAVDPGRV